MTEVIDTLDDAADRYFLAALEEDDPDDRNLLEAFGVMELERTAILSDAGLGAPAGKLAAPRGDDMLTTGNIIDLHEARLARDAERAGRDAAERGKPRAAERLQRYAEERWRRARRER